MMCDALGGPLSIRHFSELTRNRSFVDHRASGTVQLLGYASGGTLPSRLSQPHNRKSPWQPAKAASATLPPSVRAALRCAVCRLAVQEFELASELLSRCNSHAAADNEDYDDDEDDSESMLDLLPAVLCEHMQATGQLGHTEARVRVTRPMCDEAAVKLRAPRRGNRLAKAAGDGGGGAATREGRLCADRCDVHEGSEEVRDWAAALQILLDQDDQELTGALVLPDGPAARSLSPDHAGGDAVVAALLLLAAARSDTLVIKVLCAVGVCDRALRAAPSPAALATVLASAAVPPASSPSSSSSSSSGGGRGGGGMMPATTISTLEAAARRLLNLRWDEKEESGEQGEGPGGRKAASVAVSPSGRTTAADAAMPAAPAPEGHLTALHASAFLLDAEALAVMLRRLPSGRSAAHLHQPRDSNGVPPMGYAAHATERQKSIAYLFTEQPFRTWLAQRSASAINFARFLTPANVTRELEAASNATLSILRHHGATPPAAPPTTAATTDPADASHEAGPKIPGASTADASEAASLAQPSLECDIDTLDGAAISPAEVRARYVLRGRPFALRGATAGWPAQGTITNAADFHADFGGGTWEPQLLLPGNATVLAPYLRRAAAGEIRRPIAFNRPSDPRALHGLRSQVRWPAALGAEPPPARTGLDFFVGSNGSGTPLHHHSAVWNALLFGRKLWALLPPAHATFAKEGEHPLDSEWAAEWDARGADGGPGSSFSSAPPPPKKTKRKGAKKAKKAERRRGARRPYLFCVQQPGTLVYLPGQWAHATLNLEEGVGVGGFLQDEGGLGLHMQMIHAPRGMGSLQNAAVLHEGWYRQVSRAFPAAAM